MQGNTANLQPVRIAQAGPGMAPPADFGNPPSGEVPLLFNDHHVYSKPDRLKQNRVLAALVRGNEILVPLRSMFEQMGATVSYDPASKTADVSKPGSDVKVTVGKPEVVINGESRPLDVPPEIYKGAIVVPVRVISEGMGAYVQWVPEKKLVVVRYVAAHGSADGTADRETHPAAGAADADAEPGTDGQTGSLRTLHRGRLRLPPQSVQRVLQRHHRKQLVVCRSRRDRIPGVRSPLDGRRRLSQLRLPAQREFPGRYQRSVGPG
jgi:hypothetical protein